MQVFEDAYVPLEHGVQLVAPDPDIQPLGQDVHPPFPIEPLNVPPGQS